MQNKVAYVNTEMNFKNATFSLEEMYKLKHVL